MKSFLINKRVNLSRQFELDIARGVSVLFMIFIHTQEYFSSQPVIDSRLGEVIDFLGGVPSAPVFMFLLGVGVVFTKKTEPRSFFIRGEKLIFEGYLLNLFRGTLPNLIMYIIYLDTYYLWESINTFIYIDILQFAGIAMIFFGIIKYFKLSNCTIIIICIIFSIMNSLMPFYTITDVNIFSYIISLFIGFTNISFFPFLTWIFYPTAGYMFGNLLVMCVDKNYFYGIIITVSFFIMSFLYYIFVYYFDLNTGLESEMGYYHHKILGNIIFTLFVMFWISLIYFIGKNFNKKLSKLIQFWSENTNKIYFVHWLIIGWTVVILGYNNLNMLEYLILTFFIIITSTIIVRRYNKLKNI